MTTTNAQTFFGLCESSHVANYKLVFLFLSKDESSSITERKSISGKYFQIQQYASFELSSIVMLMTNAHAKQNWTDKNGNTFSVNDNSKPIVTQ